MSPSPDGPSPNNVQPVSAPVTKKKKGKKERLAKAEVRDTADHELGRRDRDADVAATISAEEVAMTPRNHYDRPASPIEAQTNVLSSPVLSALGNTSGIAAQYTSDWTKTLPIPTNVTPDRRGIGDGEGKIVDDSPPNLTKQPMLREGFNGSTPASISPPTAGERPFSHPTQYSSFGGRLQASPRLSPGRDRRSSMYSQTGYRSPLMNNPPLPHQPQPHFYGVHNLDFGIQKPKPGDLQPGADGYYCGFDSLTVSTHETTKTTKNLLLVGNEGHLDVYRVERTKTDVIGRLEGLRGSVIGAKLIPSSGRGDSSHAAAPLVALTIHGPLLPGQNKTGYQDENALLPDVEDLEDNSVEPIPAKDVKEYQTTVEIFSLLSSEHVCTLFKCPPVPISGSLDSPIFRPPPPTGDLKVGVSGKFVTVSSGTSGEIFIFSSSYKNGVNHASMSESFRCVGKVWTSVQVRAPSSQTSSSSSNAASVDGDEIRQQSIPLVSGNGRWLAIVPPASSTSLSINGSALLSTTNPHPPGLGHHTAPPQPNENCAIDAPQNDGLAGRFAREGTQAAVRGAKWAADRGMQAFQYYFAKSPPQHDASSTSPDPSTLHHFPPTHGQQSFSPTRHDSTMVSIYDLNRLLDFEDLRRKSVFEPVVTFTPRHGISHLSFSPSGTMLMTIGKKGDVQEVWNLMRITNRKIRKTKHGLDGPQIRQVARFTRMTVANVVDVSWTTPNGRAVAIVTENGTVHLYPMPSAAFQWPPARSMKRVPRKPSNEENSTQNNRGRAGGAMTSAFKAINGTARTLSNAYRSRSGSETVKSPNFGLSMTSAVGARSGKVVAMNISKSLGSAAMNFAHAGDNKIHLRAGTTVLPNSVCWLSSKNGKPYVAIVSAGNIDVHRIAIQAPRSRQQPARVRKKRIAQFPVPNIHGGTLAPFVLSRLESHDVTGQQASEVVSLRGHWAMRTLKRDPKRKTKEHSTHPLSFAELETSAPYLPFHTDRRVTMYFTQADSLNPKDPPGGSNLDSNQKPVFGGPLAGRLVFAVHPSHRLSMDDDEDLDLHGASHGMEAENRLVKRGGDYEEVQIIVTTRRKRRQGDGEGGEGEEGFFEDDCEVLDFAEDRV